ncbi:SAM-dependent methyltransferase [Thermoproteota archaeon]
MSSLAPHVPASEDAVRKMLQIAELKVGEQLYDLGSGDGRIIIMAAKEFGVKATGIELRDDLVQHTRKRIEELGLSQVEVVHGDLMQTEISDADVVTLYLTTSANEKIAPKLMKELRPGSRVVSFCFRIPGWEPSKTLRLGTRTLYLYIMSENENLKI